MTQKDFDLIANLLRDSRPVYKDDVNHIDQWKTTVSRCAMGLKRAYPYFDIEKFAKVCGYTQDKDITEVTDG